MEEKREAESQLAALRARLDGIEEAIKRHHVVEDIGDGWVSITIRGKDWNALKSCAEPKAAQKDAKG